MIERIAPLALVLPVALALFRPGPRVDRRWGGIGLVLAIVFVSFGRFSTAAIVRSVFGFPSVTTAFLVVDACLRCVDGRGLLSRLDRKLLFVGAAAAGLVLDLAALGFLPIDPYRLGYRSEGFLATLLAIALAAVAFRPMVALPILLAVAAFHARIGPSSNLWDYLVDPMLVAFALAWITVRLSLRARRAWSGRTAGGALSAALADDDSMIGVDGAAPAASSPEL